MDLNSVSANGTLETTFVTADTRTKKRSKKKTKKDQKLGTARLDLVFLVIFPLLFFLFNLIQGLIDRKNALSESLTRS